MICSPIFAARATNPTRSATADPDPDLGGGVLEPGEDGVQPQAAVRAAEGQPDRGGGDAEDPEGDGIAGGSCPGCREEQRQQRDCPELGDGRARDNQLAEECPGLASVGEDRHDESQGAGRQRDGEEQRAADPPGGVEREPGS